MTDTDARLYCVIGSPVAHSLSPYIMNKAFADTGVRATYTALDTPLARAADALGALRTMEVHGANVTYPLKSAILEFVDRPSKEVTVIGAANTLVLANDGVEAYNSDAPGTARALHVLGGVSPADKHALIYGAGGSARAAAYGLLDAGAAGVTLAVRDTARAEAAIEALSQAFDATRLTVTSLEAADTDAADIVINATPVGMRGVEGRLPAGQTASPSQCYFDFVYNPRETQFLSRARTGGARTVDGLALLVAQAEVSFHIWTGHHFALPDMYAAVTEHADTSHTGGSE